MTNLAEVVSLNVELATTDKYGRLQGGKLTLNAPLLAIDDPRKEPGSETRSKPLQKHIRELLEDETSVFGYEFKQQHRSHPSQRFGQLQTCKWKQSGMADPISEVLMLLVESTKDRFHRRVAGIGIRRTVLPYGGETLRDVVKAATWQKHRITST